jgi:uncharacterized protein (TIGR02302 family)
VEQKVTDRSTDSLGEPRHRSASDVAPTLLRGALSRAWWTILWERLWPPLASIATAIGLFLALSWAGLWLSLPPVGRAIGLFLLLVVAAICAAPLLRFRLPTMIDALRRLDRDSGLAHRPATAIADEMATAGTDQVSLALWGAHIERALRAARALKAGRPAPRLGLRDPMAVRSLILVVAVATFFGAGGERAKRIAAAFDWAGVVSLPNFRVDAWVTPPTYTGKPPVILPGIRAGEPIQAAVPIAVPVGSVLVIRSSGAGGLEVVAGGGLTDAPVASSAPPSGTDEHRFTIRDRGTVTLRGVGDHDLTWTFNAIPDRPPAIALTKEPEAQARGSLLLA